jgi:hypothetical protein
LLCCVTALGGSFGFMGRPQCDSSTPGLAWSALQGAHDTMSLVFPAPEEWSAIGSKFLCC